MTVLQKKERTAILRGILLICSVIILIPMASRVYLSDVTGMIITASLFASFVFLYFFHKRTNKDEIVTHLLLSSILIAVSISIYIHKNEGLLLIYFLVVPVFAYILCKMNKAFNYSMISMTAMAITLSIYPQSMQNMEIFRLFVFAIVLFMALNILSISRQRAWMENESTLSDLEHKVEAGIIKYTEQQELLVQTSKMACVGELLSSIVHQWKQPLASISAINVNIRITQELSGNPDEKLIKKTDELADQIEFMTSTMDDFRCFFKAKDEKIAFSLETASHKLINLFSKSFEEQGIYVTICENPLESIEVVGFENMYKQALLNIIVNARDAIKEKNPLNKNINVIFAKNDSFGIVSIEDFAGGIPEGTIERVFDKHFTTKGAQGSGIGLAMTKEIIESFCAGELHVENTPEGAKFTISIPLNYS